MHPTAKFALQTRILAASVQDEACQLREVPCFGDGELKTGWLPCRLRMWTIKEGRATVLKEQRIQSASWRKEKKLLFILYPV